MLLSVCLKGFLMLNIKDLMTGYFARPYLNIKYCLWNLINLFYKLFNSICQNFFYESFVYNVLAITRKFGRIPYTAHEAQIPPPLIFYFCFYAYFRLG